MKPPSLELLLLQLPPLVSANPGEPQLVSPDIFQPLMDRVGKMVDSAKLKCEEPIRSTDHGRDVLVCGLQSITYCDSCELQVCPKHVYRCLGCGEENCSECLVDHRCK